jgi:hypothetical protein
MYLAGRGGLAGMGMTLHDFASLGFRIIADPVTPLLVAFAAWKKLYADMADGFGAGMAATADWSALEKDLFGVIRLETLLEIERGTVETAAPLALGDRSGAD